MYYLFDVYGRFCGTSEVSTNRSTLVAPIELSSESNWNGDAWVLATINTTTYAPLAPAKEYASISPRQIRQALSLVALRDTVEAAIAVSDQSVKDWYAYSTSFDRYNPEVVKMGELLEVPSESLDNLWELAATL